MKTKSTSLQSRKKYYDILRRIITEIQTARIIAAHRVNTSLIQMYWNIGKRLSEENIEEGYGSGVVERLAVDLKNEFPDANGFSSRNLWEMKRFYEFYALGDPQSGKLQQAAAVSALQKLQQPVAESKVLQKLRQPVAVFGDSEKLPQSIAALPWGHHLLILNKVKEREEALFYIESAVKMGWTRNVMLNFIMADTYKRTKRLPKQHNFKETLPAHLREQADEMLKSSYNLGFLGIAKPVKERELEKRLVEKIKFFLLELGNGFTFIGNQHRLLSGKKEYFVDLLFFNRKLKSLVAVDLKIGEFEPEYIGKMNFYLGLLDKQTRMPGKTRRWA